MTDVATPQGTHSKRKLVVQLVAGAISGGVGMYLGLSFMESGTEGALSLDAVIGFGVALVFFLTGALVGLGALAPRFGAQALNVEDVDEVIEERGNMAGSALVFIAIAALVLGLTLSPGAANELTLSASTIMTGVGFATLVASSWYLRNLGDEMTRAASKDASSLAIYLIFLLFGGWAILAQLQLATMFSPLMFVSGFFAVYLLSVYVAVARRGLLKPR